MSPEDALYFLRPRPVKLDDLLRPFDEVEWHAMLALGWPGPDGSSCSTDTIFGVRIGVTSPAFEFTDLPANNHDGMYELGRLYRLAGHFQAAADGKYRDGCIARTNRAFSLTGERDPGMIGASKRLASLATFGVLRGAARDRAWLRFETLRRLGFKAWQANPSIKLPGVAGS